MLTINIKLWYKDGTGREKDLPNTEVPYIPDAILYDKCWWKKEAYCMTVDLDTGEYTKVHYAQETDENGRRLKTLVKI